MNKVILMGRLTRDPELRYTNSQVATCSFSVAVDRNYRDDNGNKQADFFNVVAWRTTADLCANYLSKGRQVAIMGQVQNRSYEDAQGNKRTVTEVIAESVEFIGGNNNTAQNESAGVKPTQRPKVDELEEILEDLPF
jgi:single-strand DNA-binding protein